MINTSIIILITFIQFKLVTIKYGIPELIIKIITGSLQWVCIYISIIIIEYSPVTRNKYKARSRQ